MKKWGWFQRDFEKAEKERLGQLSKNFHRKEFDSKDGSKFPMAYKYNLIKLATNIQVIRDDLNAPIAISSGYRSPSHNASVGGVDNSQHLYAKAADLHQDKETPLEFYNRIERLIKEGKVKDGGLGLYDNFIHYDVRGFKSRWNYSTLYKL